MGAVVETLQSIDTTSNMWGSYKFIDFIVKLEFNDFFEWESPLTENKNLKL